jgi:hypothetical protein
LLAHPRISIASQPSFVYLASNCCDEEVTMYRDHDAEASF